MNRLREIQLTLAAIFSLAATWAQTAGKPVYQQSDASAANYIKNRVALVGEGISTGTLSGGISIVEISTNLPNLTDENLDNYVSFTSGVDAYIGVKPIVGVRDNKRHYAADTPAGFRILSKSNSGLLSLDVIKLYSIMFYCEGMLVGTASCSNGNGGSLVGLGLISFATGDAAIDLVAVAPAEFDEIHLMPAGGINADVITSMKVQYGFVGEPYKYTLTNQGAGKPGGIEEYNTDYDHNITLKGGGGATSQNNNLIDANLDNDGPFASALTLGNVTASVTATDKTGKAPFEKGTSVGFHYTSGDLLDLGVAPTMTLELLDARGRTLQTEHLNTTVLGLGLIGGSVGDYVIKADQDFYAVKFTYASVSVKLGAFVSKYFYITPEANKAGNLPAPHIAITCESREYTDTGADLVVKVTPVDGVTVQYVASPTEIPDITIYDGSWSNATQKQGEPGKYDIHVDGPENSNYIYIKATDAQGNEYLILEKNLRDSTPPACTIPEKTVCSKGCDVTVTDNRAIKNIEVSTDGGTNWTTWSGFSYDAEHPVTSHVVTLPKPDHTQDNTPVVYAFRVTDAADNVGEYANVVTIYPDHTWKVPSTTVMLRQDNGSFVQCTYDECERGCLRRGDRNLTPEEAEDEIFRKRVEALVTKDYEEILMREYDVKSAIDAINTHSDGDGLGDEARPYYVVFTGDLNVGGNIETPTIAPPNDDIEVILDLNGYGLRVNGEPYAPDNGNGIQGNPKVSILLTDDGELEYTNASKVTGTPVLYRRVLFSTYQKGSWQSLFLPFDGNTISSVQFGVIDGVDLKDTEATLNINYHSGSLTAFRHYLVNANDNFELHPDNSTLYPYRDPVIDNISTSGYTISGSLKNTDHVATESSTFWVLTNDGNFWYSAPDNHQRPYRWVIFNKAGSHQAPQALKISIKEANADGIAPLATEDTCATPNLYTLSGMRITDVKRLPAGIYITSDKKYFAR